MPDPEGFVPCFEMDIRSGDPNKAEPMIVFQLVICPASVEACPGRDRCLWSDKGVYLHRKVFAGLNCHRSIN